MGENEGRGGSVLMLFLWDQGEGHINPALTAFLKEDIPSFHPGHLSIRPLLPLPFTFHFACLCPGRGWCSRSVW